MSDATDTDDKSEPESGEAPSSQETAAEAPVAPKRKKKKRKRKPASPSGAPPAGGGESDAEPQLDASGAERAQFLAWFPDDPELNRLVRAFEVGNYALIRARAPELVERSDDAQVRAAARELLARIEPDPLMKYLLGAAVALLLFLVLFAYRSHGH